MNNVLSSNKLLSSIKRRAMLPSDQNTFTDQDFLDMLNEEIQYFGIPHLLQVHEEYLVTYEDIPLEANKSKYRIPYRAIGDKLRDVAYVDNSNNIYELSRITIEDLSDYNESNLDDYTEAFYIENNFVVLVDEIPFSDSKLRMYFYLRPNTLVKEDKAGVITSIDRTTGIVQMSNFPMDFSTVPKMDLVSHNSPNKILNYDLIPSSVDSVTKSVVFLVADIPDELEIGDYVNIAGEAIVPQLPVELQPILAQRVAIAALEALGDGEGVAVAEKKLEKMEKFSNTLIDNRVEGAPLKVNNRHSPLREATFGSSGARRRGRF